MIDTILSYRQRTIPYMQWRIIVIFFKNTISFTLSTDVLDGGYNRGEIGVEKKLMGKIVREMRAMRSFVSRNRRQETSRLYKRLSFFCSFNKSLYKKLVNLAIETRNYLVFML